MVRASRRPVHTAPGSGCLRSPASGLCRGRLRRRSRQVAFRTRTSSRAREPGDAPQPADALGRRAADHGGAGLGARDHAAAGAPADQPGPSGARRRAARVPAPAAGRGGDGRAGGASLRAGSGQCRAALRHRPALVGRLRRRHRRRSGGDHCRLQPGVLRRHRHSLRAWRRCDAALAVVLQPQDVARHQRHRLHSPALRRGHAARPRRRARGDDRRGARHRPRDAEQPHGGRVPGRAAARILRPGRRGRRRADRRRDLSRLSLGRPTAVCRRAARRTRCSGATAGRRCWSTSTASRRSSA